MAEVLYPDGYAPGQPWGRMATIDEVFARSSVKILNPEYKKRWKGLMIASNGILGIGGAGRTTEQQLNLFLSRHNKVSSGGCCMYEGQRYQLKTGHAHAAPPGLSFHEPIVDGGCAAVDAVGDLKWAALHCEAYGLAQASWGNELWHFQFHEFPNSVSAWKRSGSPSPQAWKLPSTGGGTTPPPTTTPPATGSTYTVVAGDSWYGIASKVGCTPEALVAANPPKTMQTVIHPGDVLKVPASATKPPPAKPPTDWVSYGVNAKTPSGNPMLSKGIVHYNVQELQAILCSMPTLPADGGKPIYDPAWVDKDHIGTGPQTDNLFGDATGPALAYWQSKNGLTADSKFGPQTSAKLQAVRGK